MNFLWLVGVMCLSSAVVQSQTDFFQVAKRDDRKKFCGRYLADTLSVLCEGRYNTYFKKDMRFSDNELPGEEYIYDQQPIELKWPFLQKDNSIMTSNDIYRRYRRGVYDECCRKPCTISELRMYCGD